LAILAVSEGGLINAIGRIQQEKKGFINFSTGIEEFKKQKNTAKNVINKEMPFYIDGTSALVLSETGLFEKLYSHLPNLRVSQSVINFLIDTSGKFRYIPGQAGHMGYAKGRIIFTSLNQDRKDSMQSNFLESIKILESKPKNINVISSANKADTFSEQKVPGELSDACILAQKENLPILTEDYLYLKINELETKKKVPDYFSSLALLRALYEEGKVGFSEYLDFIGYISSYRFRFISLSHDDIEKAIFGDGKIKAVNPKNIRKFNFSLTLSEEYGIPSQIAFTFIGKFFLNLLVDNTITSDVLEEIFLEIIEAFPIRVKKEAFGQILLRVCLKIIEENKSKFISYPKNQILYKKVDALLKVIKIFNSSTKLWTPNI